MYKYNERSIQVRRTNIFPRRRELRTGASDADAFFFYLGNDLLKRKFRIRYIERSTNFLLTEREITGRKRKRVKKHDEIGYSDRAIVILDFTPRHKMERAFQYPDVSVYNRWTLDDSVPSFPPQPSIDTRHLEFRSFGNPRRLSSTTFHGVVRSVFRALSILTHDARKTKKIRPRVYCRYLARKYALTLATIVRRTVYERSPTRSVRVNDKRQISSKTESNRCRICNCNKRIS